MDTTASSFTARNNAKRAAEKMIANGKAPAVDYGIRPRDDGRFDPTSAVLRKMVAEIRGIVGSATGRTVMWC